MTRNTNIALVLSVALLGTAIEARADDHYLPGGTTERQGFSCRRRRQERPVKMRFSGTN